MTNDSRMSAHDDRTLRERLRDNDEVLAEMTAICSGEWNPGPGMVLGLLARAYVVLAATTDRLARVERHHDEHHAREKRIWDAIGGEPEDDADPEVVELDDAVRVSLQYERDQAEQARSVIDAAKAVLPEYLLAEPDLIFAVKVLAGNYAGAQKTGG